MIIKVMVMIFLLLPRTPHKPCVTIEGHKNLITGIALSPKGNLLASVGRDRVCHHHHHHRYHQHYYPYYYHHGVVTVIVLIIRAFHQTWTFLAFEQHASSYDDVIDVTIDDDDDDVVDDGDDDHHLIHHCINVAGHSHLGDGFTTAGGGRVRGGPHGLDYLLLVVRSGRLPGQW